MMVCRLTQRDPSLRMLWKLVRTKTQLSNAFLGKQVSVVDGLLRNLKGRWLLVASLSIFRWEVRGLQQLPQVITLINHCWGWDGAVFFFSGPMIAVSRLLYT